MLIFRISHEPHKGRCAGSLLVTISARFAFLCRANLLGPPKNGLNAVVHLASPAFLMGLSLWSESRLQPIYQSRKTLAPRGRERRGLKCRDRQREPPEYRSQD